MMSASNRRSQTEGALWPVRQARYSNARPYAQRANGPQPPTMDKAPSQCSESESLSGSNKEKHQSTLRALRQSDENPVKGRRQPRRGFARINVDQEGIRASFGQDCGKVFARVRQGLHGRVFLESRRLQPYDFPDRRPHAPFRHRTHRFFAN